MADAASPALTTPPASATWPLAAAAAELKVLTAGAFKPVLQALAPGFEQRTGHRLVIDNDTAGALQKRIAAGEAFDLVVLTPGALDALGAQVAPGSARRVARVAIGVAVKQGALHPLTEKRWNARIMTWIRAPGSPFPLPPPQVRESLV